MISNSLIKFINSLKTNKYRNVHQKFIAEGPKIVSELLNSSFIVDKILATKDWMDSQKDPDLKNINVIEISEKELKKISALKTPNKVLAIVNIPDRKKIPSNIFSDLILMLDEIKDPGNMGTIVRTADWFGIPYIICSDNCVDIYNPKVVQATMGSISRVKVYYTDLYKYLQNIPSETKVFATMLDGKNIYRAELDEKGIILIGNESRGISKNLESFITDKISIPSFTSSKFETAESLNASVATAIVCAEFRKRFMK